MLKSSCAAFRRERHAPCSSLVTMKLSLRSALLVATSLTAFTAFGCSNASEPEVDSDQGAIESPTATGSANAHLAAVGKCDKAYTKASNKAVSTNDMIQASAAFGECNKRANDAVVARIEKNLRDAGSPSAGQAAPSIAAFRAAQVALCSEMDKASPNFGGSLSRVEATSCRSSIEVFLAALIDENVALGDEARGMKEDRSHHLGCYKAFDKRLDQAVANNDMVQATHTLARCIQTSAARLGLGVGRIAIQNDPAAGPEAAAGDRVKAASAAVIDKGGELCGVLNQAGENGTGSLSNIPTGSCKARVAEAVYSQLRAVLAETSL